MSNYKKKSPRQQKVKMILTAIKKLSKRKVEITIPKIAKLAGLRGQTLRAEYFDFIRENCKGLVYMKGHSILPMENRNQERLNEYANLSDKALGIGLEDHNTYRR